MDATGSTMREVTSASARPRDGRTGKAADDEEEGLGADFIDDDEADMNEDYGAEAEDAEDDD